VAIVLLAHSCGFLPTSRQAPRSFVMTRDYRDMRRIFLCAVLPPSFKILRIHHPGSLFLPSPDGPSPILYEAAVTSDDYLRLVAQIDDGAKRMEGGFDFRRGWAMFYFNKSLGQQLIDQLLEPQPRWSPLVLESVTTKSLGGQQYQRRSYVAVDDRSSDSLRLYITTPVPYENEEGYPAL
jgi:hypothetical protein